MNVLVIHMTKENH